VLAPQIVRTATIVGVPAALAFGSLTYLVPAPHRGPLLGAALFLLFSALARYWLDDVSPRRPERSSERSRGVGLPGAVCLAAAAAFAFRAFVARPYRVDGASMLPTLEPGDLVAGAIRARRTANDVSRGDVVVFGSLVKRVIGLPGDRIAMRGGTPVINGWVVPECDAGDYLYVLDDVGALPVHGRLRVEFLGDRAYLTVHAMARPFVDEYLVKPGEVFVLGDDRGNSLDSRSYGGGHGGGVPLPSVEAVIDRFLVGTHRDGKADFGRALHRVDALPTRVRLEGIDAGALEQGIARCLSNRPNVTRPPAIL
jgi:signal peptidase I